MKWLCFAVLLCFFVTGSGQVWTAATRVGDLGSTAGHGMDVNGNMYMSYEGIWNNTWSCMGNGIYKFNEKMQPLWYRGTSLSTLVGVKTDGHGNSIIGGLCEDTITTFCSSGGQTVSVASPGPSLSKAAVAVYDSAGNYRWSKIFDWPNANSEITSVAVDKDQSYIVAGVATRRTYDHLARFFLYKFDSIGNVIWVDTTYWGFNAGFRGLTVDSTGGIFMVGETSKGTMTLQSKSISVSAPHGALYIKYSRDGQCLWVKVIDGDIQPGDVHCDGSNGFYVIGLYMAPTNYDGRGLPGIQKGRQGFVAKHDTAGNLIWVSQINALNVNQIVTDSLHDPVVCGSFWPPIHSITNQFSDDGFACPPSGTSIPSIFVAKLNSNKGNTQSVITADGHGTGDDVVTGCSRHRDETYFVTGIFSNTVSFGSMSFTGPENGIQVTFTARLGGELSTGVEKLMKPRLNRLYPNPATSLANVDVQQGECTIVVTDISGRELMHHAYSSQNGSLQFSCDSFPQGVYFVTVLAMNQSVSNFKLVKE